MPGDSIPVITFDQAFLRVDTIVRGTRLLLEYPFTNSGTADLDIELVTACKCAELEWPLEKIPPGGRGLIRVWFDSSEQETGYLVKTVDIIANTQPIVVEAKFSVIIKEKKGGDH